MPELVTGYTTEQKVVTVLNDDGDINEEITLQAVDSWIVSLLVVSDTNMVILFTRTFPTPAP